MKIDVPYKGKVVQIELDEAKLDELVQMQSNVTGYGVAKKGEKYWYVDYDGKVEYGIERDEPIAKTMRENGNYYTSQEVAAQNARADTLLQRLRKFAVENGGLVKPGELVRKKWCIELSNGKIVPADMASPAMHGIVYFAKEHACKNAIAKFYADLQWYFNEYVGQL